MKKRVYIAYTGGTIGMLKTSEGYKPQPGFLREQMEKIPELHSETMPEYVIKEYDSLLDSSNITSENWIQIAADITKNYEEFDGFVVIHGTDTMAYTASALSFMLEGLGKPVILTGSQIPLCEIRSDARENLITAILIAGSYNIPEVCLFFGDKLLRGNRAVKIKADQLDAFNSPNFPPLGVAGVDIKINWDLLLQKEKHRIQVNEFGNHSIATLRIFPGISAEVVKNVLKPPLKGLVLETYGVGNGPDKDKELINVLREAIERGVVITACTQCLQGSVNLNNYAVGSVLQRAGVINGYDLTEEAALTKMYYLFSQGLSTEEVKVKMQENICGELTLP